MNVDDVEPVAGNAPKRRSATLEAVSSQQRNEIALQEVVEAIVCVHRVLRASWCGAIDVLCGVLARGQRC